MICSLRMFAKGYRLALSSLSLLFDSHEVVFPTLFFGRSIASARRTVGLICHKCGGGRSFRLIAMPSDSEKEQYTIGKHFSKYVGNVQKSPAKYFSVAPKLLCPKHVEA